nr:AAA family ATPase [Actinomyces radicidentis]
MVGADGAHLARTLWRMASDGGADVYSSIAAEASRLTDIRRIEVNRDDARELLTLEAQVGESPLLAARSLSDGTLRFLTLCVIEADPESSGLICMEEPENGIHPGRISAMADLVRELAVDPAYTPGPDNPLRQVIVNTHSPYFVDCQHPNDLLLAELRSVVRNGRAAETIALVPMKGSWRDIGGTPKGAYTSGMVQDRLRNKENGGILSNGIW